jgi:selenocysteine-specific elongation factor
VVRPAMARRLRRLVSVTPRAAAAIAAALLEALAEEGLLVRDGDSLRVAGAAKADTLSPDLLAAMDRLERALDIPAPPALEGAARSVGCPPEGVRALEAAGRIVRLDDDLAYAAAAFARIQEAALRLASGKPLLPADLRDATGTSRKYVLAVIEELDRRGILRRTAEGHVVGPRAPR